MEENKQEEQTPRVEAVMPEEKAPKTEAVMPKEQAPKVEAVASEKRPKVEAVMPEDQDPKKGKKGEPVNRKETQEEKDQSAEAGRLAEKKSFLGGFFTRVRLQEKVLFARHLAVGIKAGMSLQDSLRLIEAQSKSKAFKKIVRSLINDTANGMFLSKSMEKYERIFGHLFINIVRVGETSGTLTENLGYISTELKKRKALRSKVRGALIYPAVIMVATIGIVATLMIGVFPKILPVFSNLKIKLPITTRILIVVSDFTTTYTLWIGLFILAFIIAIAIISRYEWFKQGWHHVILMLPIVSKIAVKVNAASISRVLGLLLKSGVRIIEAVNITADAMDNRVYRQELKTAGETLRRGDFFSIYLAKKPKMFPPVFVNMLEVGENTGNLTENLDYLAEFYEEEVDEVLKNLSSIIEPFLLLFMGVLVGFIALSVVTPIYSISQSLTL